MRKFYTQFLAVLTLLLAGVAGKAQVVVTATAGTTGPTTYTTLKAAVDAITAGTHSGSVLVSISGNTTETAPVVISKTATTATWTALQIKPAAGASPTIASVTTFNGPLIDISSASGVVIDGSNTAGGTSRDLTISNTDTLGSTIRIQGGSSNNVVRNCIIRGSTYNSGIVLIGTAVSPATTGNNDNLIENNDISNNAIRLAVAAVYNTGTSGRSNTGNIYRGNRISGFSTYGFLVGNGSVGYASNTLFEGNEIFQGTASLGTVYGIQANHISGITNLTLSRNNIHDLKNTMAAGATTLTVYGIDLYDATSINVVNNMILLDNAGATSLRGIAQESAGTTVNILYNTVLITGNATPATASSFAYLKNYTSTADVLRNNIFVNRRINAAGTGKQYAILNSSGAATPVAFSSNYNLLFSSGNANNYVGGVSTTAGANDYATLAAWQTATGYDANSISVDPLFVSATDLHLQPVAANSAIDNKGTPVASVTVDFDGNTRSTTTPDIGADEFTVVANAIASVNAEVSASALWPNAVQDEARLRVVSRQAMSIRWVITDATGRTVRSFTQQAQAGENFLPLQLGSLQAGAYNITGLSSKGGKLNLRFVKL